jgi:hypothetical protein
MDVDTSIQSLLEAFILLRFLFLANTRRIPELLELLLG